MRCPCCNSGKTVLGLHESCGSCLECGATWSERRQAESARIDATRTDREERRKPDVAA